MTNDKALEAARAAYEYHQDISMDQQHSSVSTYIDALENALQAMQARAEAAEREGDALQASYNENAKLRGQRDAALALAKSAEARVKELEEQSALVSETLQSVINCPQGDLWNYATTPTAKERLIWAARVEVATEISALMPALTGGSNG